MKMMNRNWRNLLAAGLACAALAPALAVRALDVVDPTGVNYTSVSDSSHYNGSYVAANLFDQDVTGVAVGTLIPGAEYARNGAGDSFVAFQLDQIYTNIGSIFYAQRNGSNPAADKVATISLWTSSSTPFSAVDPGVSPASVVATTNTTGAQWTEYLLTNSVAGQYFLLKLHQSTPSGNPGGTELRLGAVLGLPPALVQSPVDKTVYVGGTARFNASATGTAPLAWQWFLGSTPLNNGGRISGADTPNLTIASAKPADAGIYTITVTNRSGAISATGNLAVVSTPTNAAEAVVIADQPLAFWQLNDPVGATNALDLAGTFNGLYGDASGIGVNGPQPPADPGFSTTNTAVQVDAFTVDSAVTVPPLNISPTNSVTLLAWIYQASAAGPQQPYTGIVYCRGGAGQTSAGMIFSGDGTQLAYQWAGNRYNFSSGLVVPDDVWTLVALVYTPADTTLYCGTTNGIVLSAVDDFANPGQAFEVPMKIGLDTDAGESARTFNGEIDDVAFFNRALSSQEISAIYDAGVGLVPSLQILGQSTNLTVFQGQPLQLSVQVSGLDPAYQWYKQNAPIAGATNSSFTIPATRTNDAGNYYVVVTNSLNSVTSSVITVTIPGYVVLPIGPSGAIYTGVSASSSYPDPNYVPANLFDSDLTGVSIGAHLSGKDWADDGYGTSFAPAFLAFQVDQAYPVSAILYAQRNSQPGQTIDKVTTISLWASLDTPFSPGDPGTTPDAVVSIPDIDAAVLHPYVLPATITGQYFVIKVEQNPTVYGSNIGGNEFRLATLVTPVPLTYSNSPAGLVLTWPVGATLLQADDLSGPWVIASGVTSGVPAPTTAARRFYRIQY